LAAVIHKINVMRPSMAKRLCNPAGPERGFKAVVLKPWPAKQFSLERKLNTLIV